MNTVKIADKTGIQSYMVRVPKFKVSDVIPGGRDETHPAFIVNGNEVDAIFISKYQNVIFEGIAHSLPYQQPATGINFDEARKSCEKKGNGWHLMSNAEWAAVALMAKKNGTMPHGNNNWGKDYRKSDEHGICVDGCKILTGSGPASFSHDGTEDGIYDLNGNVWEWISGLRLKDGELQVIPDNNAASHADQSTSSREWKPIKDGKSTVKICETEDGLKYTTKSPDGGWSSSQFSDLTASIEVPDILKELALFPADDTEITDRFWADLSGESLPIRGGSWLHGTGAGVFGLGLGDARSDAGTHIGFRSAFVNL